MLCARPACVTVPATVRVRGRGFGPQVTEVVVEIPETRVPSASCCGSCRLLAKAAAHSVGPFSPCLSLRAPDVATMDAPYSLKEGQEQRGSTVGGACLWSRKADAFLGAPEGPTAWNWAIPGAAAPTGDRVTFMA